MKQSQRITVAERAFESNLTDLMKRPNVVGAEIGYRERGGKETDEVVVQVLVERKVPSEELSPKELLPAELAVEDDDGPVGVDVVEVGRIELPTSYRPLQGGVSVSRTSINSRTGTLGGWAVDTTDNKVVGISARHVLGGTTSSRVLQPAKAFGGSSTDNEMGRVKRQVEESPDRTLRADAAITSIETAFDPFCGVAPAILEIAEWKQLDKVEKRGCMTRLTSDASIISPRPVAIIKPSRDPNGAEHPPVRNTFRMSYKVPASGKRFAIEGDSGSLVFRLAPGKVTGTHPVLGVVIAVREATDSNGDIVQSIYASPISEVFSALKLTTLNGTKTTMKDTGWTSGWTSFLPYRTFTGNSRYLGYKAATGQVTLDQIRPGGAGVDTIGSTTWAAGWTSLMPFRVPGGQGCMRTTPSTARSSSIASCWTTSLPKPGSTHRGGPHRTVVHQPYPLHDARRKPGVHRVQRGDWRLQHQPARARWERHGAYRLARLVEPGLDRSDFVQLLRRASDHLLPGIHRQRELRPDPARRHRNGPHRVRHVDHWLDPLRAISGRGEALLPRLQGGDRGDHHRPGTPQRRSG